MRHIAIIATLFAFAYTLPAYASPKENGVGNTQVASLEIVSHEKTDLSAKKGTTKHCAGQVRSSFGATACVSPKYQVAFQGFINDLEAAGATIRFLGGIRGGRCGQANKHPCGMAMDYCQLARGVVDRRCNLPGKSTVASLAARHGLFEGGQWCNSDYGHVEAGGSAACGQSWAARSKRVRFARHFH